MPTNEGNVMPINKEEFQRALSTRYGGSLLVEKTLLNQDEVIVFIGLGGLGGRAVNAIKAAATEKLNNPDRRFFLAVDTCEKDMNDISAVKKADIESPEEAELEIRGCLDEDEKHALYKDTYKIKTLGHDIDSWLNRDQLAEVEVDKKGAQGIRQIGRVMLMANGNYEIVYNKLYALLNKAKDLAEQKNVDMKIYIVAGISGGTGSGTVVDFSYMVKRACGGFDLKYKQLNAILFTPDVQYNDQGIDDNKKKGLQANFYAAIKEVDFFYNNKARKVSYKCPYSKHCAAYEEDIFDSCTLVSRTAQGIDISSNSNGVIKRVADALTFEISGITGKTNRGVGQSYSAFFSNVYNNFQLWWPSNSHGSGLDMPDWAPSRYSSLAYSSFYVPRDELMAYCANLLMERLAEHWKNNDITEEELKAIFRKYHLASNRAFAGELFRLAECEQFFDVADDALPKDGFGPAKVKNCQTYLELMRDIATDEGTENRAANVHLVSAKNKQDRVFVNPIISLVDNAFTADDKGPVYAINLLSAGVNRAYTGRSGILAWLNKLVTDLPADNENWNNELSVVYEQLSQKAGEYDGSVSVPTEDLRAFTEDCRQYGEALLKCKLLGHAVDYLKDIYKKLNQKNETVFKIYTYAFEYLVEMLHKDSEYVADTNRHREGQTTVFSFDLTEFQENERNSERFKEFFKSVVDNKKLAEESKTFVDIIFGGLKQKLDPAVQDENAAEVHEVKPKDVIDIIRTYFQTSFAEFTTDVIEKFCVVVYSDVEATAERITEIWNDPTLKGFALDKAAKAIEAKINNQKKIMMTCADVARDLQNFVYYETFASLRETTGLNNHFTESPFILQANWSEFIGFKRIFGFPLSLLADLDNFKREYDAQATTAGIHLDEMYSEDEQIGDWRVAFPEPYSYTTARFLKKYVEGGNDTTERDKLRLTDTLELAEKAKSLGLLIEKTNSNQNANNGQTVIYAENGQTYYELVWKLIKDIDDFDGQKASITENIRKALSSFIGEEREYDFFKVLIKAGYRPAEGEAIQWTFMRPEFNVMQNRTDMGDDVDFGNFIILLRSNPYWYVKLKKGVELFEKLNNIYETVLAEYVAANKYKDRLTDFMKAIRVGRIVPFYVNELFTGYKIKVGTKADEDVNFVNRGLDSFDQKFLIYLCFTESYMYLDADKYAAMKTLVEHDFNMDLPVNYTKEACDNVDWFINQANEVINDSEYLAHYDVAAMQKNFRENLKYSKFNYSLPTPSKEKQNVEAVISNLKDFYTELRRYLEKNKVEPLRQKDSQTSGGFQPQETPKHINQPQGNSSWRCLVCGATNTGKFCNECGAKKPEDGWRCPACGATNTGKFCIECGTKKPEDGWRCPVCGTTNTGKFCSECGAKPVSDGWVCTCGATNTGKFCSECGRTQ